MKIFDNVTEIVRDDDMESTIKRGSKVSIAAVEGNEIVSRKSR